MKQLQPLKMWCSAEFGDLNGRLAAAREMLKTRCASLLEQIESLSRQVSEDSSSVRQLERDKPSVQLPVQPQAIAQNEPDDTEDCILAGQRRLLSEDCRCVGLQAAATGRQWNRSCWRDSIFVGQINTSGLMVR